MSQWKYLILFLVCLNCPATNAQTIRIGAALGGHGSEHRAIFEGSRKALEKEFGQANVEFTFLHSDILFEKVKNKELDFFISAGGKTRKLLPFGSHDLLTITSKRFPDPNRSFGGVFLVLDSSDIHTLEDLQGKIAVSNRKGAAYGHNTLMSLLESSGFDHNTFFKKTIFPDTDNRDVITTLLSGQADVAMVPSCFLEDSYPPDSGERKQLRAIHLTEESPCLLSTPRYPNWTLASVGNLDPEIVRRTVKTLLTMEEGEDKLRWSFTTDYSKVDQMHENLQSGIFEKIRELNFRWISEKYKNTFLFILFVIFGILLYAFSLKWLVNRRTRQLSIALKKQIKLKKKARDAESRFLTLQRLGLISQISSMIAHELRQPLSASVAYIHGLKRFIDSERLGKKQILEILDKLLLEVKEAEKIVDEVRSYAKGKTSQLETISLDKVLNVALSAFKSSGRFEGTLKVEKKENPVCRVSPLEIELAITNILRNSAFVLNENKIKTPTIEIEVTQDHKYGILLFKDNGPKLTEEAINQIQLPLHSSKKEGLGLGLSLVKAIIANHGGEISFLPRKKGGLIVLIKLPLFLIGENHD